MGNVIRDIIGMIFFKQDISFVRNLLDEREIHREMLAIMLAVCRCGKFRPHALFAFDAMLLTAAGRRSFNIVRFIASVERFLLVHDNSPSNVCLPNIIYMYVT